MTSWSLAIEPKLQMMQGSHGDLGIRGLCRWDCMHYAYLATHGYDDRFRTNFFPLLPLLGGPVQSLTRLPMDVALFIVTNAFGFVALAAVYRLFASLEGEEVAGIGVTLLAAWPFAFFETAPYPHSMLIAFSALALLWAQRGEHLRAGVALGLGGLARHLTMFAGLGLLAVQIRQRGVHPKRLIANRAFIGLVLPLAIAGLYPLWQQYKFHDSMAWLHAQTETWGDTSRWSLWKFLRGGGLGSASQYSSYAWFSFITGAGAFWLLRDRRHWALAAFAIPLMLCLWTVGMASLGRYTTEVWPAFLPLAMALSRWPALKMPVILALSLAQGLYLYLFVHVYAIL